MQPPSRGRHTARLVVSSTLAAGALWWVASELSWSEFVAALRGIDYPEFLTFMLVFTVVTVAADAFAIQRVLARHVGSFEFGTIFALRATSHLASIVNYHLGQAWLTWLLSRKHATPVSTIAGTTLLGYASTLGALLVLSAIAFALRPGMFEWLGPFLLLMLASAAGYLCFLRLSRRWVERVPSLGVLAEAGLTGHLLAVRDRLPHAAVLFLGQWIPFAYFDIHVPVIDALVLVPVLLLVGAMPITPQGLGARDVLALQLFTSYAAGTPEVAAGRVAAYSLSWALALTLGQAAISIAFAPLARRKTLDRAAEVAPTGRTGS